MKLSSTFKHSGIYPVNRAIIDAYILTPSKPYKTSTVSVEATKSDSSVALALKAMEEVMDTDMKQTKKAMICKMILCIFMAKVKEESTTSLARHHQ